MFLIKMKNGSYIPTYDSDKIESDKIKVGDEVKATYPRNVQFHRKGFALLKLGFENQDKYDNFEIWRQVVTMKAGFVHWVKGLDGTEYPLPMSLSFEKMKGEEYDKWYNAIGVVVQKECQLSGVDIENHISDFY